MNKFSNNGEQAASRPAAQHPSDNLKEYLNIIRQNIVPILIIFLSALIVTIIYVTNAIDIYKTTTTVKITKPQGSVLYLSLIHI